MVSEMVDGGEYCCNDSCGGIISCDELGFFFEIDQCAARPSNAHERSTFF
jgi:hypothetical protein